MASIAHTDKQRSTKKVAVVGAGVSGLAAAYRLKLQGLNVTVFEAEGRAGGKLRTVAKDGLVWDEGANTMTDGEPQVRSLLDSLALQEKQQYPISRNKRYIVRNGLPELIPTNPIALIKSNILSAQSKLQVILEPLLWKRKGNFLKASGDQDESVAGFFQRHFGKEVVDYLIDPFIGGTSAGDPDSISVRHAFPDLWNLEQRFGSILIGGLMSKLSIKRGRSAETSDSSGKSKLRHGSFSFHGGMQTLINALCKELDGDLELKAKVLSLSYGLNRSLASEDWSVSCGHGKQSENKTFDAVIMTAPLGNVKDIKINIKDNSFPLDFIPEVNYLPLSVVITTFKKNNVVRPLEGFGVLVPSREQQNNLKTLGTLFSSMMFPDRAPSDLYMYTTFIGGSRNRELAKASKDELKQIVSTDLRQLLGAEGEPTFINHYYWSKAFPLYDHNHGSVLEAIEKMEKCLPGFFYAGNHRGGLSVGKAIASGCKAADLVISYLESLPNDKALKEG